MEARPKGRSRGPQALTKARIEIAFVRANRENAGDDNSGNNPDRECTPREFCEARARTPHTHTHTHAHTHARECERARLLSH